jgi:hypothetical protein
MENVLRCVAFSVNLAELCVLAGYYWPLMQSLPTEWMFNSSAVREDTYVSDLLFRDSMYRSSMTGLVALHLCVCAAFMVRLNASRGPLILVYEIIALVGAWAGWVLLNSTYRDYGHITLVLGTALFTLSSSVYFGIMAWNVAIIGEFPLSNMECLVFLLAVFLFSLSLGAAAIFALGRSSAWIFEHAAFMLFVGANIFLFIADALVDEPGSPKDAITAVYR